jgi:hypothetical protein
MYDSHEQIMLLLPWYCNGTLADEERLRVGRHIESCLVCRKELAQLNLTATAIRQNDQFASSPQSSFAKIAGLLKTRRKIAGRLLALRRRLVDDLIPYQLLWVLPALLLTVMIVQLPAADHHATFQTLTSAPSPDRLPLQLSISFNQQTSLRELDALLGEFKGSIVDGPSLSGMYIIEIPVYGAPAQQNIVSALRTKQQVKFVERIAAK